MKIKIAQSIPELLRQLPEGTLAYIDLRCLSALKECVKALRTEHEGQEAPNLFLPDVRASLVLELNDALAQIIKARIPRQRANAKPKADDTERKELQDLKRAALEMREALEKFSETANAVATREVPGTPVVNADRHARLMPALDPVASAFSALRTAPTRSDRLRVQVQDMNANWNELSAATGRWCNVTNVLSTGKAGGVHKYKALAAWLEACRRLSRDIAEELREIK
jgi:hypothetical protein